MMMLRNDFCREEKESIKKFAKEHLDFLLEGVHRQCILRADD